MSSVPPELFGPFENPIFLAQIQQDLDFDEHSADEDAIHETHRSLLLARRVLTQARDALAPYSGPKAEPRVTTTLRAIDDTVEDIDGKVEELRTEEHSRGMEYAVLDEDFLELLEQQARDAGLYDPVDEAEDPMPSSQTAQMAIPHPFHYRDGGSNEAATLLAVNRWVTWLVNRFNLADQIPPCWYRHGFFIEELMALHRVHLRYVIGAADPDPQGYLLFVNQLSSTLSRFQNFWRTSCAPGKHVEDMALAWDEGSLDPDTMIDGVGKDYQLQFEAWLDQSFGDHS